MSAAAIARRFELPAGGLPQVDAPVAPGPRKGFLEALADVGRDGEAAGPDARTDDGGAGGAAGAERPRRLRDDAGEHAAPAGVDERQRSRRAARHEQHRHAVGEAHEQRHAGLAGEQAVGAGARHRRGRGRRGRAPPSPPRRSSCRGPVPATTRSSAATPAAAANATRLRHTRRVVGGRDAQVERVEGRAPSSRRASSRRRPASRRRAPRTRPGRRRRGARDASPGRRPHRCVCRGRHGATALPGHFRRAGAAPRRAPAGGPRCRRSA